MRGRQNDRHTSSFSFHTNNTTAAITMSLSSHVLITSTSYHISFHHGWRRLFQVRGEVFHVCLFMFHHAASRSAAAVTFLFLLFHVFMFSIIVTSPMSVPYPPFPPPGKVKCWQSLHTRKQRLQGSRHGERGERKSSAARLLGEGRRCRFSCWEDFC